MQEKLENKIFQRYLIFDLYPAINSKVSIVFLWILFSIFHKFSVAVYRYSFLVET